MPQDAVAHRVGEIQAASIPLEHVDDAQALLVVAKSGERLCERRLAGVAERGVAEVVPEADRLDEILVQPQGAADRAGDLGDFQGVRETGAVVVAGRCDEDLGLVHEAAEALGMEDAVTVALKGGTQVALGIKGRACGAPAARGARREEGFFTSFELFADCE